MKVRAGPFELEVTPDIINRYVVSYSTGEQYSLGPKGENTKQTLHNLVLTQKPPEMIGPEEGKQ